MLKKRNVSHPRIMGASKSTSIFMPPQSPFLALLEQHLASTGLNDAQKEELVGEASLLILKAISLRILAVLPSDALRQKYLEVTESGDARHIETFLKLYVGDYEKLVREEIEKCAAMLSQKI